jgi:acetyl-CoA C-acetyltransferase
MEGQGAVRHRAGAARPRKNIVPWRYNRDMLPAPVFIVGAARTPIGRYGGALRDVHPAELGAVAARAALARAGVALDAVDEIVIGHARQAGSGPNPARQVGRRAGLPDGVPGTTVNKACASGLEAAASGARVIALGEAHVVLAGGIESMSRMPYLLDPADSRWGHRMGHFPLVDAMYRDGFRCSLCDMVMGETAELLARELGIGREESDRFALTSQERAARAMAEGAFDAELAPVTVEHPKGPRVIDADEHPRPGSTLAGLAALPPVFTLDGTPGIVTAGSSSGITDGGAAVVLAGVEAVAEHGLQPMARILGWTSAGVDPRRMGIGPVPAVKALLQKLSLHLDDFDLVELNEAFAPQVIAVLRELPIDPAKLNVNGGAIALGHPIGCTGARILVTLVHALRARKGRLGLATLCVSGGMGMALAVEMT